VEPIPIHVYPHTHGGWAVLREGEEEPLSVHTTAWHAEKAALAHAYSAGGSVVVTSARQRSTSRRAIE
jgi:hypothetical protein